MPYEQIDDLPPSVKDHLVESMGGIILGTSELDPDVRLWVHPAPDNLRLSLCSCGGNHGSFHGLLPDY